MNKNLLYRSIPKVDVLLENQAIQEMIERYSRDSVMEAIRAEMDDLRAGRMNKETCDELTRRMEAEFAQLSGGKSLPPVEKTEE